LNASQALEESERYSWSEEVGLFWDFVSSSKRGLTLPSEPPFGDSSQDRGEPVGSLAGSRLGGG
jgi:hypothetical protein